MDAMPREHNTKQQDKGGADSWGAKLDTKLINPLITMLLANLHLFPIIIDLNGG